MKIKRNIVRQKTPLSSFLRVNQQIEKGIKQRRTNKQLSYNQYHTEKLYTMYIHYKAFYPDCQWNICSICCILSIQFLCSISTQKLLLPSIKFLSKIWMKITICQYFYQLVVHRKNHHYSHYYSALYLENVYNIHMGRFLLRTLLQIKIIVRNIVHLLFIIVI